MSKNNKGKNSFYFFMIDWKTQQEKLGKSYPGGLRDVQRDPQLSVDWSNLSHEKKAHYQSRAKDSKIQAQGSMEKRTALGESLNEVDLRGKKEQEFYQNMLEYIQSVITMGKKHNSLDKLKFIFIHVNWFYRRDVGINKYEFCPAEFAVAEFSLDAGIENVYHEIVSMKIPLGWRGEALEMSQETHKIPVEHPDGQSDFAYMYEKLVQILKSNMTGNKYPPLFTVKDMAPVVVSLLEKMCEKSNGNVDDFLIYSLEALFGGLRNAAAENVDSRSIPLVVAEDEFGKDFFAFVSGLECEFHKISDSPLYCSMSIVKRWGYTICDHCCEYLDIPMIDGIHRPMPQANFNSTRQDTIDLDLSKLSISAPCKTISMTGVGSDYREKVSERTHKDEQRRRNQCKQLEIIDHGKHNGNNIIIPGRPLRPPKTVAKAVSNVEENYLDNFPVLGGRGTAINGDNIADMNFPPLGRGRGKYVQI
ncbi:protein maelstrom homolog [Halictus rubicundus]|uniref:protein maelstrom homolog n=1 Tax=Halictus rubicundus TaxID=77578 RepID=UPI004035CD10